MFGTSLFNPSALSFAIKPVDINPLHHSKTGLRDYGFSVPVKKENINPRTEVIRVNEWSN